MRSDYIKKDALENLLAAMPVKNALAVRLSLETGMRVGDCVSLRWANFKGQTITYTAQKTGKTDKKKITKPLLQLLQQYGGDDFVFASTRSKNGHIARQTVYRALKKAARLAGVTANVTPHSARKIYAVEMRDKVGIKETQRLLQHTSPEVTALYAMSDVALGGTISAAEFDRLVEIIASRTAQKVVKALFKSKKKPS